MPISELCSAHAHAYSELWSTLFLKLPRDPTSDLTLMILTVASAKINAQIPTVQISKEVIQSNLANIHGSFGNYCAAQMPLFQSPIKETKSYSPSKKVVSW